jgi:hypothetical protein
MLDTHLHYRINGRAVQWYTPTFGGGLPAFFNPQHIQVSLPQLLLFVADPWTAGLLSLAITSVAGYVAIYGFLRSVLKLDSKHSWCSRLPRQRLLHRTRDRLATSRLPAIPAGACHSLFADDLITVDHGASDLGGNGGCTDGSSGWLPLNSHYCRFSSACR